MEADCAALSERERNPPSGEVAANTPALSGSNWCRSSIGSTPRSPGACPQAPSQKVRVAEKGREEDVRKT